MFFPPTAESFGVSAKLGPGALWGSHPARFRGSKKGLQVKDSGGSKVPSKGSKQRIWKVLRVPSQGSKRFPGSKSGFQV